MNPTPTAATMLSLYLGETDRHEHRPLYEVIVMLAREQKLAGATVLRGPLGFGASSHVHSAKILQLSADLPIVIQLVDDDEKIRAFWSQIQPLMKGGLAITQTVQALSYGPKPV